MATHTRTVETYSDGVLVGTRTVTFTTSPEQDNEETLLSRADAALVDLAALANGTGSMTTAQLTTAVRGIARALLALSRLYLRRLDAVD